MQYLCPRLKGKSRRPKSWPRRWQGIDTVVHRHACLRTGVPRARSASVFVLRLLRPPDVAGVVPAPRTDPRHCAIFAPRCGSRFRTPLHLFRKMNGGDLQLAQAVGAGRCHGQTPGAPPTVRDTLRPKVADDTQARWLAIERGDRVGNEACRSANDIPDNVTYGH